MTGVQLALDWTEPCNDPQPSDQPPTRFDCRQHEMRDLHGQGPEPKALWTAHTIHAPEYL